MIYEFLRRRQPQIGDVITFEDFTDEADVDVRRSRTAFYRAANQWCEENHRAFIPVKGVGYRVAQPTEHELEARKHHRKSRRSMGRGLRVVRNTDYGELSPADQARFRRIENEMSRQADVIRRLDLRQDRMQEALEKGRHETRVIGERQEEVTERVAQLEEALRRHGIEPD